MRDPRTVIDRTIAGKYAILSELGRGGMGEVFLAGVDDSAKQVRRGLSESLSRISRQRLPLYRATTSPEISSGI